MTIQDWAIWEHLPYVSVFGVLVIAGLGVPFPEDIPLLTGGYLCHRGLADVRIMIIVALVGVLLGDSTLFYFGRRFGHHVTEHRFIRRYARPERIAMAEVLFAKHGLKILFVARFVPGLRSMVFLTAGVLRLPYYTFIGVNGIAAAISVPLLVLLGYYFGDDFDALLSHVRTATHVVVAAAVVIMVIAAIYFWRRRKKLLLAAMRDGGGERS